MVHHIHDKQYKHVVVTHPIDTSFTHALHRIFGFASSATVTCLAQQIGEESSVKNTRNTAKMDLVIKHFTF